METVNSALQVQYDLDPDDEKVTYDFIANSLYVVAKKNVNSRRTSGVGTRQGLEAPSTGIKMPDGSIFTGYYKNFLQLSDNDKSAIIAERKRLNISPTKRGQGLGAHKTSAVQTKTTKESKG